MAVDIAGWIVQSNQCRAMTSKVNKPHLRNVFFRAAALQALNIHVGLQQFFFQNESKNLV